jgi:hypothetical protein
VGAKFLWVLVPIVGALIAVFSLLATVLNLLGYADQVRQLAQPTSIAKAVLALSAAPSWLVYLGLVVGIGLVAAPGIRNAVRDRPGPRLSGYVRWLNVGEVLAGSLENLRPLGLDPMEAAKGCMLMTHVRNQGTPSIVYFDKATVNDTDGNPMKCVVSPYQHNFMPYPAMPVLSQHEAETNPLPLGDGGNIYVSLLVGGNGTIDERSVRAWFRDVNNVRFLCVPHVS